MRGGKEKENRGGQKGREREGGRERATGEAGGTHRYRKGQGEGRRGG